MNLPPPSVTVSTHTSAFKAVDFQSPAMPNALMSLCTQSVRSFSFPLRPLRTAPSGFPKTIRFGSRPPLIRRSVPAHKSLLVRNVVSMLPHPVISRARLYEVIRWSGLLRCALMIRSRGGGMHMVSVFFADAVNAKARHTSTMTSIILASPCGDRETMQASSAYSMPHTARRT